MANEPIPEENVSPNQPSDEAPGVIDPNALPDTKFGETKPKQKLGNQEVTIERTELIPSAVLTTARDGISKYREIALKVHYKLADGSMAFENYGGIKRFPNQDGTESDPVLSPTGTNQAALLLGCWCGNMGKVVDEVSLKEFINGLNGAKVKLKEVPVNNPQKNEMTHKNVVETFIGGA